LLVVGIIIGLIGIRNKRREKLMMDGELELDYVALFGAAVLFLIASLITFLAYFFSFL
jgi:hypothetical protein